LDVLSFVGSLRAVISHLSSLFLSNLEVGILLPVKNGIKRDFHQWRFFLSIHH
jgi:hypothetical protein